MKKRNPKGGPDPIDAHVGSRVRARRVGLRLSQTKLGYAIGVTFQQVQKYENGTNRIGASNLYKVAKALAVDVAYFYEGVEESAARRARSPRRGLSEDAAVFQHDPLSSREATELMHNYFRIPDLHVRKRLSQFVKSLAGPRPGR
ncbi:MAG: helix-turn-helix transcriptional regulator [Rhodospirillales bacterium]|jgi:transcriptional regulator with XRE-family HTH domain|nr:helix-turn-helix transcriptional regulator [Rhodospirillales bacterium]MDP6804243.1 helix-turn-helix transcriptional regulator [Rhodospirillales bacterium]